MTVKVIYDEINQIGVPESAVTIQGNTAFVYIVNADTAEKKNIKMGKRNFGKVSVVSGINEGDTVIIKRTDTADNGKIVVALIDDHEAMLKRLRRKGKTVALESANRNYETKIFGPDRVKVQGILVSLYRNFH